MNEKQQKLYGKLLKKVNEYCLGFAAEDIIEAIDNLVENYEDKLTEVDGYATRYAEELGNYRNRMKEWQSGHSVDFSKVRFEVQNLLPDPNDIGKRIKALEIIKKKNIFPSEVTMCEDYADYLMYRNVCEKDLEEDEYLASIVLTKEEYELLKEILK